MRGDLGDVLDRLGLDDLDDQPLGGARSGGETVAQSFEPYRRAQRGDRDVHGEPAGGLGGQPGDDEFEHALVDEFDQPQLLGDRDHRIRAQHRAVVKLQPHQRLLERGQARMDGGDRLISQDQPALVERCNDLVGDPGVAAARLRRRLVGRRTRRPAGRLDAAPASASSARCSSRWAVRPWRGASATPTRVAARMGPAEVEWNSAAARRAMRAAATAGLSLAASATSSANLPPQ